jgi:hypothetical protein
LLLHLGACVEAVKWAGSREISAASLAACPSADWRRWLEVKLRVGVDASFSSLENSALAALSGYGDGYGYGYGDGYGYGYGYGYGDGDGDVVTEA